ncbi:ketoreductase [Pseudohyphozyma bogoriensis]|nr:ketoreductase [Pseudohyphozyma bogoriensis]
MMSVSGFLGSATLVAFVSRGVHVRATVRSQSKADAWVAQYPEYKHLIEWCIVPDIAKEGAFIDAVKGVTRVVHTASPFHFNSTTPSDLLDPAIKGTLSILEAALTEPAIKTVVITSSDAAIRDHDKGWREGYTYTSADWNPFTMEQALAETNPHSIYVASKALAERAAWKFMDDKHPSFTLTTICPVLILGPMLQPVSKLSDMNLSTTIVWDLFHKPTVPDTWVPMFVDVRDCALAHYEATFRPVAAGKRYLCAASEHYSDVDVAIALREAFPEEGHRIPTGGNRPTNHYGWDSKPAEEDLGIKWTPLAKCVEDCGKQLLEMEKAEKGSA